MNLQEIKLHHYKNTQTLSFRFDPGMNILYGKNAAGKTNILEAIFLFAAGRSFRGGKDRDFIRFGEENAALEVTFTDKSGERSLGIKLFRNEKRQIFRSGVRITRLSEYLGLFRAVIFTPDHLNLIKGSPEFRRRFMDMAISQSYPRYVAAVNEYNKILAQKNALLKNKIDSDDLLAVYNERLAVLAGSITSTRYRFVCRLHESADAFLGEMTDRAEQLILDYSSQAGDDPGDSAKVQEGYQNLFESRKQQEKLRGITLYGPHKDDFTVLVNGKNARIFCSQGQQRSVVLALKLAEGEISRAITGEYPVFLLDDILSELDATRKSYILEKIRGRQVIITGCEKEYFETAGSNAAKDGLPANKRIYIEDGKILKEEVFTVGS